MSGLGVLLFIVGLIMWLTIAPAIGAILMVVGVVLFLVGLFAGRPLM